MPYNDDALQQAGTAATALATWPAGAAPANGVTPAAVWNAIFQHLQPKAIAGIATITDANQTETTAFAILTITPAAGAPLADVEILLDLAKATNGFAAVESVITAQFALSRKIDGTNWRREAYNEAALSGTNAALRAQRLVAGSVGATATLRVEAVFSADVTADMQIPYIIYYKSFTAPTVA